jgi:poly(A) polymerase
MSNPIGINDLTPHLPAKRPLIWAEVVLDLQELLYDREPNTPLYLVGGAVRDAFLHRIIKDIDFVTPSDAIRLARKITNHLNAEMFVMDAERGVARIFWETSDGKKIIDVTQFRGNTLLEDLQERDFTINAIAVDFRGDIQAIIDPLKGESDAENKLLRRCMPHSLASDPLRALRAVRQSVALGFHIETNTLADIRAQVGNVKNTSSERIRDEFFGLLSVDKVASALRIANAVQLLEQIIPETKSLQGVPQTAPHVFDLWAHTLYTLEKLDLILMAISPRRSDNTAATFDMGMLAIQLDRYRKPLQAHLGMTWANDRSQRSLLLLGALLHLTGKVWSLDGHVAIATQIAERCGEELALSNPEKKLIVTLVAHYETVTHMPAYDVLSAHRFWYRLGDMGIDVILLGLAHYLGVYGSELVQSEWLKRVEIAIQLLSAYFDLHDVVVQPPTLVNGNDLMNDLNIPPSRLLGQTLDAIREAQVLGQVKTREEALAFANTFITQAKLG